MGHVPSKTYSQHPFVVDMETSRGHIDSVAAFALTTDNFPNPDHPLFRQFQEVRCDAPVLFWYCAPPSGVELPPEPPEDTTFSKRFVDTQQIVNLNLPPNEFVPLPIMLVRLKRNGKQGGGGGAAGGGEGTAATAADDGTKAAQGAGNGESVDPHRVCGLDTEGGTVIGYFGCRSFGSKGTLGSRSIVGIFLNKQFFNDAKSIAIISIACKAYQHFSIKAGCRPDQVPWPTEIEFDTQQYNLPCLRLIQKIYQSYVRHHLPQEIQNRVRALTLAEVVSGEKRPPSLFNFQYVHQKMYAMCTDANVIVKVCEQLAAEVLGKETPGQTESGWVMKAAVLPPFNGVSASVLDELVEIAKSRWRIANEPVIRQQLKSKLHTPQRDKLLRHQQPVPRGEQSGSAQPAPGGKKGKKNTKEKDATDNKNLITVSMASSPPSSPTVHQKPVPSDGGSCTGDLETLPLPPQLSSGSSGNSRVSPSNKSGSDGDNFQPQIPSSGQAGQGGGASKKSGRKNSSIATTGSEQVSSWPPSPCSASSGQPTAGHLLGQLSQQQQPTAAGSSTVNGYGSGAPPPQYAWSFPAASSGAPEANNNNASRRESCEVVGPPLMMTSTSSAPHVPQHPPHLPQRKSSTIEGCGYPQQLLQQPPVQQQPHHWNGQSQHQQPSLPQVPSSQSFNSSFTSFNNSFSGAAPSITSSSTQGFNPQHTQPNGIGGNGSFNSSSNNNHQSYNTNHHQGGAPSSNSSHYGGSSSVTSEQQLNIHPQLHTGELYVGDLSPVFVCNQARQWTPVYWNEAGLVPLRKSIYQLGPDGEAGGGGSSAAVDHVCYDLPRAVWVVDNQGQRFQTDPHQPYVFMEKGILLHAFVGGSYVPVQAQ